MKISAHCGGGLAGQVEHIKIDTANQPDGQAIETLLEDLAFFSAAPPAAVGADLSRCTITADDGPRRHTLSFAEDGSAASAPWQALMARLRAAAR
ncbi:MAG: protealysin inhibitor emfourin [Pseudomonadota bacterium]